LRQLCLIKYAHRFPHWCFIAMKPRNIKTYVVGRRDPAVITVSIAILAVMVLVCAMIVGIALWSAIFESASPILTNP
jgi:hypothetical protein